MTDADLPAVIGLLESTLGPAPGGVDRAALFSWKHVRGPFGPSIARVAEMDGQMIGLRSFMRWTLIANGERVLAVRAVDTATASSAQRRGVFSRLTTEALETAEEAGVRLVFNTPNAKSRPGYLKMGWQDVTEWPMRLKLRRPDRLLVAAARRDLRSGPALAVPRGAALRPAHDPAAVGALTEAATWPQPGALHTDRTAAYLRWRYAEGPIPYHVLAGEQAVVICRLRARGALREVVVCEVLAAPGAMRALPDLLRRIPMEAAADHAVAFIGAGWPASALLGAAGYRRVPRAGMVFTVRPLGDGYPDAGDPAAWSLTLGDLEVF